MMAKSKVSPQMRVAHPKIAARIEGKPHKPKKGGK